MTQLIHPSSAESDGVWLTITMAVAVCRALEELFFIPAKIKWVNDIYLGGKKLAGILAKGAFAPDGKLDFFAIGVGINVYGKDFPKEIENTATSIECHSDAVADRNLLASKIISELYSLAKEKKEIIIEEYRTRSVLIGKKITVHKLADTFSATVLGVTDTGALKILKDGGETEELLSGEVSVREC
jgi:BirA family biotin operon repressor/biotin-[acetyl-CoA-carboxylase] ligase